MKKDDIIDEKCKRVQEILDSKNKPMLFACKNENVSRATFNKWKAERTNG